MLCFDIGDRSKYNCLPSGDPAYILLVFKIYIKKNETKKKKTKPNSDKTSEICFLWDGLYGISLCMGPESE